MHVSQVISPRRKHGDTLPPLDDAMITGHVFIATSLDGFVARKSGELDWLMKQETKGEDHGYDAFMASVDGLVMGRGSFETVMTFEEWPYEKPVVVMSRTLGQDDVPAAIADRVTLTRLDPAGVMKMLDGQGWRRVYVDGGKVVQSFLRDGLIADMALTRIPILLGDGLPLFGVLDSDIDCEHLDTRTFPSGLVTSRYRVVNNAG
mgnify:CR=1 FL=1